MHVKYNYLDKQFGDFEEYLPDLRELVASGEFTLGPYVDRFEKKFAKYIGVKHVIAVNNGTDALILSLKAVGVKAGDEVITVANTFYATAGAIVAVGARPVFVDSDDRHLIDVKKIEAAITSKTKAILPVHWAGCPAEMDAVMKIADQHGIPVIEDACPATGAKIGNKMCGSFGKVNAFSMHPLKPLNVMGDGGMIVTNDDKCNEWLRVYRNHGMVDRDHIDMWGINARLQPFQAVIGYKLLDKMESVIGERNRVARQLDKGLADLPDFVRVPRRPEGMREAYQLYLVRVKRRDELLKFLIDNKIEAKVHYPLPLHLQKPARALGYKEGDFPVAEQEAKEIITLPAHQYITPEQGDFIIERIHAFYKK
ncbi:MAG: DegT/DnrJ/EryC1/StrS family aminotransferase [Oligoflexia bacterium]|nr:DegT/DnrJ/EryC1/StrS family aminotransferase [Oligoflexia bacterium]